MPARGAASRRSDVEDALALVACDRLLGHPQDWQLRELDPAWDYRAAIAWGARVR